MTWLKCRKVIFEVVVRAWWIRPTRWYKATATSNPKVTHEQPNVRSPPAIILKGWYHATQQHGPLSGKHRLEQLPKKKSLMQISGSDVWQHERQRRVSFHRFANIRAAETEGKSVLREKGILLFVVSLGNEAKEEQAAGWGSYGLRYLHADSQRRSWRLWIRLQHVGPIRKIPESPSTFGDSSIPLLKQSVEAILFTKIDSFLGGKSYLYPDTQAPLCLWPPMPVASKNWNSLCT